MSKSVVDIALQVKCEESSVKKRYRSSVWPFKIRKVITFYVPDDEDLGIVMSQKANIFNRIFYWLHLKFTVSMQARLCISFFI